MDEGHDRRPARPAPRAEPPGESLARELWAIGVLYLAIAILPVLIGLAFAPPRS